MPKTELEVYLDVGGATTQIGHAWFTQRRGGPVTTVFAYSAAYLAQRHPIAIDPRLDLVSGNQYVDAIPGAFQDCAPDRWGRKLINKRHQAEAPADRGADLNEVDYLTGVSDRTRQGALRFKHPGNDIFIHAGSDVPRLIHLPRLLRASHAVASDPNDLAAIKDLLNAGTGSLGGARPKASVLDTDGSLLIAKFPGQDDEWDVMAWECVALDIAEQAGIETPQRQLVAVADAQNVLLVRRFDRTATDNRIPYMSSMTALDASDGEWHDYTEIAEAIADMSARAVHDLTELYRRAAFNVAIHNTDDHLRNHGFLAIAGGWTLSPVFDINPNPSPTSRRVTGISGATGRSEERDGLVALAVTCRLDTDQMQMVDGQVAGAVAQWRTVAAQRGLTPSQIDSFADIFEGSKSH